MGLTPIVGTYTVDNYPGWGMGTIVLPGGPTYEFVVHDVDPSSGVAGGFQFTLETPAVGGQTRMGGGDAVFQQP